MPGWGSSVPCVRCSFPCSLLPSGRLLASSMCLQAMQNAQIRVSEADDSVRNVSLPCQSSPRPPLSLPLYHHLL